MIIFTLREIENAWRNNLKIYETKTPTTNAHRLMLFYAVECGLKAAIMRRRSMDITDSKLFAELGHNINKLLDELNINQNRLRLPKDFRLEDLRKGKKRERRCSSDQINQMWRYGHSFDKNENYLTEDDKSIEEKLIKIVKWIERELAGV